MASASATMSSGAAAADASAPKPLKYVVVVGDTMTGKSSWINGHLPDGVTANDMADVSDSSLPVTQRTHVYPSRYEGIMLVDTVGLNVDKYNLGLTVADVEGKLVHFVVLLNNGRWQQQYQQVLDKLSWAKPQGNISRWAGYCAAFKPSQSRDASAGPMQSSHPPPSLMSLGDLTRLPCELVPMRPAPEPEPEWEPEQEQQEPELLQTHLAAVQLAPSAASKATKAVVTPPSKAKQWFGRELADLSPEQTKLHDYWLVMSWPIPAQRPMQPADWLLIKNRQQIVQHCGTGEALLELHLLLMHGTTVAAQYAVLERLVSDIPGLKQHVEALYEQEEDPKLLERKYSHYVEALFQIAMADKTRRRHLVHLLRAVRTA